MTSTTWIAPLAINRVLKPSSQRTNRTIAIINKTVIVMPPSLFSLSADRAVLLFLEFFSRAKLFYLVENAADRRSLAAYRSVILVHEGHVDLIAELCDKLFHTRLQLHDLELHHAHGAELLGLSPRLFCQVSRGRHTSVENTPRFFTESHSALLQRQDVLVVWTSLTQ